MRAESGGPASGSRREPIYTSPPNPACLCDWTLNDTGTYARAMRVRAHPGCPVDHEGTRKRR